MREVCANLRFTSPCLGAIKRHRIYKGNRQVVFELPKNGTGRVVFLPTWWQAILTKAASIFCHHQSLIRSVRVRLEVEGQPRAEPYHRYYKRDRFSRHEAFLPGDAVVVQFVIPDGLSVEDFSKILVIAGRYFGISPHRPNEFGFFDVDSVQSLHGV